MIVQEFIVFVDKRLVASGLKLSTHGKLEIEKKWKLLPDKGGYSNYWKTREN